MSSEYTFEAKTIIPPKELNLGEQEWIVYRWVDEDGNELEPNKPIGTGPKIDTNRRITFHF